MAVRVLLREGARKRPEALLDHPVFQAVEADDPGAPRGNQDLRQGVQQRLQLTQLVVGGDAQGLEGPSSGMNPTPPTRHGGRDHLGQVGGSGERASSEDGLGDATRVPLFAVAPSPQQAGDLELMI